MRKEFRIVEIVCSLLLFVFIPRHAEAQYFSPGEEPAKIKWQELRSPRFSIIFPTIPNSTNSGNLAEYYFNLLSNYKIPTYDLDFSAPLSRRFPIVIHPLNASSNGVTLWAPRQIHLMTTPPADMLTYPQDWNIQLALHEWRHAWQIAHFNKGFWKILSYLAGEQAVGLASGIYPSSWFLEGDAVVAETEYFGVGRGTSASFLSSPLNSIIPSGSECSQNFSYRRNRSWDRWRFGSLKHFSPNIYDVGYMINSMARFESKDYHLPHKILEYERRHPFNPNVVAAAFRKYSGHTHREYTQDSLLQKFYTLNTPLDFIGKMGEQPVAYKKINTLKGEKRAGTKRGYHTKFDYILELNKDSLLAIVSGYATTPNLILLKREGESWKDEILRPMTNSLGSGVNVYDGRKMLWTEEVADKRWGQLVRSRMFIYDVVDRDLEEIELRGADMENYLYSPSVVGDTLYALCYSPLTTHSKICAVKNLRTQENLNKTILDLGLSLHISNISLNEKDLYFIGLENGSDGGIYLYKVADYKSNSTPIKLLGFKNHNIKNICLTSDKLYFITDYFGTDMVCSISLDKDTFPLALDDMKVESSLIGVTDYEVSSYNSKLYVAKQVADLGPFLYEQDMQNIDVASSEWEFEYPLAKELHRQKNAYLASVDAELTDTNQELGSYEIKPYSKLGHLMNFWNWTPFYMNVNSITAGSYDSFVEDANIGFTATSQNRLGTAVTMVGYSYNLNAHRSAGHIKMRYSGWYPVLEGDLHIGDKGTLGNKTSVRSLLQAYIPFNLSKNGWQRGITPQVAWQYKNYETVYYNSGINEKGENVYKLKLKERHLLLATLGFYSSLPTTRAGFFPRLGIGGRLYGGFSPGGGKHFGNSYAAYLYGYLPGIALNQSLRLSAAWQHQSVKRYFLDNFIAEPRGYTEEIYAKDYIRLTADYAIPLYLGDISLGAFAYLKGVNIVPFYDFGVYRRDMLDASERVVSNWRNRSSVGADVIFRTHLFRIGYPISIGFRYAHTSAPVEIGSYSKSDYREIGNNNKSYCGLIMEVAF